MKRSDAIASLEMLQRVSAAVAAACIAGISVLSQTTDADRRIVRAEFGVSAVCFAVGLPISVALAVIMGDWIRHPMRVTHRLHTWLETCTVVPVLAAGAGFFFVLVGLWVPAGVVFLVGGALAGFLVVGLTPTDPIKGSIED